MSQGFWERLFLAFRIPGYRWIWSSSFFAASGFMTSTLVQGWLILELTDSPLMVGLAPALGGVVNMAVSPFGGVLADRLNRRSLLIFCQSFGAAIFLALGLLTAFDIIQLWHLLAASTLQGANQGVQQPARSSLMYDLGGRRAVMNAMAGQFMAFHAAGVIGSFVAGLVLASFGAGPVFLGVSGLVSLAAFLLTRLPNVPRTQTASGSFWGNLGEGLGYTMHDKPIRAVMSVILLTETLGFSSRSMFPVVARDVLHAGPVVLGLLSTVWAVGGITSSLVLSGIGSIRPKGWVFMGAASCFGAMLLLFALSRSVPLSLALALLAGGCGTIYDTLANTLLQTLSPDSMRGRVMGLYSVLISGFSVGALVMGSLASLWGATAAIAAGGGTVSLNALRAMPAARLVGERSAAEPITIGGESKRSPTRNQT